MEHPWIRLPNVANMLGLMLGALGIFLTGLQLENIYIEVMGILAFVPFILLFSTYLGLLIDDYITLYPQFTRRFLGIPY